MLKPNCSFIEFSQQIQVNEGWDKLKDYLRKLRPQDILTSLGMEELYCSWLDIEQILSYIEEWMNFTTGIQSVHHRTVELIESGLMEGRTTHELDIDSLISTLGIRLIPIILECRKKEVESAKIYFTTSGKRINVRNLKRTYYGQKLMRELRFTKFTRRVSKEDFQRLQDAVSKLGLFIQNPRKK